MRSKHSKTNSKALVALAACGLLAVTPSSSTFAASLVSPLNLEVQQQKVVNGVVKDEKGEPVIGASVTVKGSKSGVITDMDGKFHLPVPEGSSITVSYVGYEPSEISTPPMIKRWKSV